MWNIREIGKTTEAATTKTRKIGSNGENFSDYLQEMSKPENKSVSTTIGVTGAEAIFAAQVVNDEEGKARKKQAVKRGFSLIEKLEEIRDALLLGYIAREKLIEISRFVKDNKNITDDAQLNEIISEIELRIEVELAKLTR